MRFITRGLTRKVSYNRSLKTRGFFTTRGSYNQGSYNQGSYNQASYNQGFLQTGVLEPGVLTSWGFASRGCYN